MAKTVLKNKSGENLDLDGGHVIVQDAAGKDSALTTEIAALRSTISGLMAASDALVFKDVLNAEKPLPASGYQTGWVYKVAVAGTYAGYVCEVGDMLICVADCGETPQDSDWQAIQTNIDGAVTGPATATDGDLAAFNASGRVIKDSAIKMADAADAVSKKHAHANSDIINALGKNEAGKLTYDGNPVGDGLVDCVVINAGEEIPANLRDNGVIFEIQASA